MPSVKGACGAVLACLGLVWLSACATATSPQDMSISTGAASSAVPGSLSDHTFRIGEVGGGNATIPIWLSDVSNDGLRTALATSLKNLGYLADDESKASYVVTATIIDIDRPGAALDPAFFLAPVDMNVTARIHYTVTPVSGGRPVFDDVVATTGVGAGESALTPNGRVRKGAEAAVRLNIAAFLQRLKKDWK